MKTKRPSKRPAKKLEIISHFPAKDSRPIVITGSDATGKVVAEDKTDAHWHAGRIATSWKESGLSVVIEQTTG